MTRELCEVQGLIFKRKKYKEADVLTKIMTEDHGIFTIDVRGALRPKSRLGAATLNFSYGKYIVNTNWKGISTLRTFKDVKQLDQLYLDLTKNAYSSYVLDLLDHAFVEYKNIGSFYDLIMKALLKINSGEDAAIITQMVQLKLLNAYGVAPQLDRCLICGKVQGVFDYSMELGGIICSDHFNSVSQRMHLDPKVVALIRTLALVDIDRLGKIKINPQLKKDSGKVIDLMYVNYLDLNLKTKKFLDELALF